MDRLVSDCLKDDDRLRPTSAAIIDKLHAIQAALNERLPYHRSLSNVAIRERCTMRERPHGGFRDPDAEDLVSPIELCKRLLDSASLVAKSVPEEITAVFNTQFEALDRHSGTGLLPFPPWKLVHVHGIMQLLKARGFVSTLTAYDLDPSIYAQMYEASWTYRADILAGSLVAKIRSRSGKCD